MLASGWQQSTLITRYIICFIFFLAQTRAKARLDLSGALNWPAIGGKRQVNDRSDRRRLRWGKGAAESEHDRAVRWACDNWAGTPKRWLNWTICARFRFENKVRGPSGCKQWTAIVWRVFAGHRWYKTAERSHAPWSKSYEKATGALSVM